MPEPWGPWTAVQYRTRDDRFENGLRHEANFSVFSSNREENMYLQNP